RGDSRFTTWATAIAVRLALGLLRKRKHAAAAMDAVLADGRSAVDALAPANLQADDAAAVLRRAIDDALTPTQREALLAELGGLTLMEIARRTGRSRGALYKLLHDARKRLLTHLREAGYGPADLLPDAEVTA
ncbi:MAG: sigma-70 family RNA polymerase sigma factor, partial [Myxococcota bacterium]